MKIDREPCPTTVKIGRTLYFTCLFAGALLALLTQ